MENLAVNHHWKEQRVFVTGATGMVGSWLVKRLLQEGAYVVTLIKDWDPQTELIRSRDIDWTHVVQGRLEDYSTIERALNEHEIDTVFHLGAQTLVGTAYRNPLATFESNIRGTYNVLEACRVYRELVKRVVIASSDKAYGEVKTLPYTEDMPPQGQHPYDVSKSCTDLVAMTYAHTYELPITVARCGNIYGGGDLNWSRIVPGTIRSVCQSQSPVLRSDGTFVRDYIFVQDVVDAYLRLGMRADDPAVRGEAFNFSCEQPLTVMEITMRILKILGRQDLTPVILNHLKGEIQDQYLDSSKAKCVLNWKPRFGLDEGLKHTIQWYEQFLGASLIPTQNGNGKKASSPMAMKP